VHDTTASLADIELLLITSQLPTGSGLAEKQGINIEKL
jgi:hypothetical protein